VVTPSLETTALFAVAALTLLLIPGPAVMYITALGIREGRTPALAGAIGVGVGNFVHVIAATLGLSALLVSSALAFTAVKYVGAAYLVYLGVQALRHRGESEAAWTSTRTSSRREFRRGVMVNVLNPKVAIFFLAFVPQFIDPERGSVAAQVFMLGSMFVVLGIITDSIYAVSAGALGVWLRGRRTVRERIHVASGLVYIALGLLAVITNVDRSEQAEAAGRRV
jgi:threonine/homoserine/homoserine lactone efflux protein